MSLYHLYFCSKLSSNLKVLKTFHFMMYNGKKFNAFNFELNLGNVHLLRKARGGGGEGHEMLTQE